MQHWMRKIHFSNFSLVLQFCVMLLSLRCLNELDAKWVRFPCQTNRKFLTGMDITSERNVNVLRSTSRKSTIENPNRWRIFQGFCIRSLFCQWTDTSTQTWQLLTHEQNKKPQNSQFCHHFLVMSEQESPLTMESDKDHNPLEEDTADSPVAILQRRSAPDGLGLESWQSDQKKPRMDATKKIKNCCLLQNRRAISFRLLLIPNKLNGTTHNSDLSLRVIWMALLLQKEFMVARAKEPRSKKCHHPKCSNEWLSS